MNRESGEYQRAVGLMVQNEIRMCISTLVSEMFGIGEDCPDWEDLQAVAERGPDNDDWREALESEGYSVVEYPEETGNWYAIETKHCEAIRVYHTQLRETCIGEIPTHGGYWFCLIDENGPECFGDDEEVTGRLYDSEADAYEAALSEFGTYLIASDEDEALQECARNIRADEPDRREVYEHWIVSSWLYRELEERGEAVTEWCGLKIWGRCTTGQAICLDSVICEIYDELHKDDAPQTGEG